MPAGAFADAASGRSSLDRHFHSQRSVVTMEPSEDRSKALPPADRGRCIQCIGFKSPAAAANHVALTELVLPTVHGKYPRHSAGYFQRPCSRGYSEAFPERWLEPSVVRGRVAAVVRTEGEGRFAFGQ